ncbi:uncharacterized protein [Argopecten irradians]|uniref:uncharacterized protein n=1 Tax=Argopecten irradians TaxID=31199 RepID=UPI003711B658
MAVTAMDVGSPINVPYAMGIIHSQCVMLQTCKPTSQTSCLFVPSVSQPPLLPQDPVVSPEIVTPIIADKLADILVGYDIEKTQYLVQGFREGFRIHFEGDTLQTECPNLVSASEFPEVIQAKIDKELLAKRVSGPFSSSPYPTYHLSPIGVVPKKESGKYRMIHHLSHPKGISINDGITEEASTVSYANISDAIDHIKSLGQFAFLSKTDIESAFRIVPIHPAARHLLGFKWNGELYFDNCLPMGLSESCKIFEELSKALEWVAYTKLRATAVVHVLDDFLFIEKTGTHCQEILSAFQDMCKSVGIPLAPDKTFGPSQILPFLGITLDTINMESRLPLDKLQKALES